LHRERQGPEHFLGPHSKFQHDAQAHRIMLPTNGISPLPNLSIITQDSTGLMLAARAEPVFIMLLARPAFEALPPVSYPRAGDSATGSRRRP